MIQYACGLASYDWLSDEIAYTVTKAVHGGYDIFKDKHQELKEWTLDQALKTDGITIPYHPGSIKYFKEIGKWTPEHEKWQAKMLKEQKERIDGFKAGKYKDR